MNRRMPGRIAQFFIPVYHDTESFLVLREKLLASLPDSWEARFHLLDDSAGQDACLDRVRALPDVEIVPMPYNLGHQRALVHGLREWLAFGKPEGLVVTMDGDGEDRPEDVPLLIGTWESRQNRNAIVLAKRTSRVETFFFKSFYLIYKNVFRCLTGTLIQTGNFAVYHSDAAKRILYHPSFDLSYASTLFALGSRLVFVPCPRGQRYSGRSKMNFSRLAIHGVRMLMPFMDRIAIRGVIVFTALAALFGLAGLSLAGISLIGRHPVSALWFVFVGLGFATSFLAVCSFTILITIFANVQGVAMARAHARTENESAHQSQADRS